MRCVCVCVCMWGMMRGRGGRVGVGSGRRDVCVGCACVEGGVLRGIACVYFCVCIYN